MKKIFSLILCSLIAIASNAQQVNSHDEITLLKFLNNYFSISSDTKKDIRSFHIFHDTLIIFHSAINESNTTTTNDTTLIALEDIAKINVLKGKGKDGSTGVGLEFIPNKNKQLQKGEAVAPSSKINPQQLASTNGTINQKMAGQSAGVVVGNDNSPGGNPKVRIRGITSVNANSNPLYIVDDVPISNINTINPDDIASVEVLKDPSSTAMYGVRGANGVIIIKTKRGDETNVIPEELVKQKELSYVLWTFGEKAIQLKDSKEAKNINALLKTIRQ